MTNEEVVKTIEKLIVQKYDEDDEYALLFNDGPGILITHVQLKDNNFEEWTEAIEMALESKNKLGFLDGSILQHSEGDAKFRRWKKINTLIESWILNTIEPL